MLENGLSKKQWQNLSRSCLFVQVKDLWTVVSPSHACVGSGLPLRKYAGASARYNKLCRLLNLEPRLQKA